MKKINIEKFLGILGSDGVMNNDQGIAIKLYFIYDRICYNLNGRTW